MRAYGADLIEQGEDFTESLAVAGQLAEEMGLHLVPSFDDRLVRGVATYALELFTKVPQLDRVYVPIGLGSGICGTLLARDVLGRRVEIVGVVAEGAPAYADSFDAGRLIPSEQLPDTIADGVACRIPQPDAFERIRTGVDRVVRVDESGIRDAMRSYFSDCHQVAEGAGAISLGAALLPDERERNPGKRIAVILSGGNVDSEPFASVLHA